MSWSFCKEIGGDYVDIAKFSDGCWVKYYLSRACSQYFSWSQGSKYLIAYEGYFEQNLPKV